MRPISFLLLVALAAVVPRSAPASIALDPRFGSDGSVTLGFDPVGTSPDTSDQGIVSCAGPLGSLISAGLASGGQRVVVTWLTEAGVLDTRFSVDGKETIPIVDGRAYIATGLCLPSGKILLVYSRFDPDVATAPDWLVFVRIDPATGLPDPAFGDAGQRLIDVGSLSAGVNLVRVIRALGVTPQGDLLAVGYHAPVDAPARSGLILKLSADGDVLARNVQTVYSDSIVWYAAVGTTQDGTIWIGGTRRLPSEARLGFVLRVDADSFNVIDVPYPQLDGDFAISGGRMLGGDRMLISGRRHTSKKPLVAIVTSDHAQVLELPVPSLSGGAPGTIVGIQEFPTQVAQMDNGDVLFAGSATEGSFDRGVYLAQLSLGSGSLLRLDMGGVSVLRALPAGCAGRGSAFRRFTLWAGRPTVIGSTSTTCGAPENVDYLIQRVELSLFEDSFE